MWFDVLIRRCRHRLFEWLMTMAMLLLAIEIILWPTVVGSSAFRYILLIVSSSNLASFFLIVGLFRIVALIANGTWPVYGPRVRAIGAGCAALIWGEMMIALVVLAPVHGVPSPGIPVYFALTIGEIISAYRAATDVGRTR